MYKLGKGKKTRNKNAMSNQSNEQGNFLLTFIFKKYFSSNITGFIANDNLLSE